MATASYLAVTPAHNEEEFLPQLIDSLLAQTTRPARWLIVDDGSTDRTGEIAASAAHRHSWIHSCALPKRDRRRPGGEGALTEFVRKIAWDDSKFLLRCDADITLRPDYVSSLLDAFEKDPQLGIAGGELHEKDRGDWRAIHAPGFKTPGPCKFYSRQCFEAIGGIKSGLGWDTIDDLTAWMLGFTTVRLRHLPVFHHRATGSARGLWRGRLNMGEAAYNAGYHPVFFLARAAYHAFDRPFMMGGLLMLIGFVRPWLKHQPHLAEPDLVRFIRAQQLRRLTFSKTVWR